MGLHAIMMPNGSTYYYFSDNEEYSWYNAVKVRPGGRDEYRRWLPIAAAARLVWPVTWLRKSAASLVNSTWLRISSLLWGWPTAPTTSV